MAWWSAQVGVAVGYHWCDRGAGHCNGVGSIDAASVKRKKI